MRWKQPSTRHKSRTRNNPSKKDRGSKRCLCPFYFVNLRKLFHARSQQGCGVVQVLLLNHCRNRRRITAGDIQCNYTHTVTCGLNLAALIFAVRILQLLERQPFFLCNLYTLIISIQIVIGCQVVQAGRRTFSQLTSTLFRLFRRLLQSSQSRLPHQDGEQMPHSLRPRSSPVRWW